MKERAAIFCANGIGDALLMSPLAHALGSKAFKVDVFHPNPKLLEPLFPVYNWMQIPNSDSLLKILTSYDKVFIENDNSANAWEIINLRNKHGLKNIFFLFPTPCPKASKSNDFTFKKNVSFSKNLENAVSFFLGDLSFQSTPDTFLKTLEPLNKDPKRIVIHPLSKDPRRNWKKSKFLSLANKLHAQGYTVSFVLSHDEYPKWEEVKKLGLDVKSFSDLKALANFIATAGYFIGNDSGIGHLASLCKIPTLTISGNHKRVKLWRPGFCLNKLALPFLPLPCFKGINFYFREWYWQSFVSVHKVLKTFKKLTQVSIGGVR